MHPFSTPWKHLKIYGYLVFSGGREKVQRNKWVKEQKYYLIQRVNVTEYLIRQLHVQI